MLSFLPQTHKQKLLHEYKFRLITVLCSFISLLLIVALVGLLPVYLNEKVQADALRSAVVNEQIAKEEQDKLDRIRANTILAEHFVSEIKIISSQRKATVVISSLFADKPDSVSLQIIRLNEKALSISGVANTRNDLIAFEQSLKNDVLFDQVNLPIADLAKNTDATFTIDITIK